MRNWNPVPTGPTKKSDSVFSLPMRNWNCKPVNRGVSFCFVFSLPMRNWNSSVLPLSLYFRPLVFSLPMRNWNNFSRMLVGIGRIVFSLPMRNWNGRGCHGALQLAGFSAYLWGIETHCNGFYPGWRRSFSAYLWGIETSHALTSASSRSIVFSLPMRNWNCNSFATNQHLSMVFSLPMRNWNGKDWRHSKKGRRFQPTYEELKPFKLLHRL